MTQEGKELRQALGLVDHDATRMGREERLGIGSDEGQVPRALKVEVEPSGEEPTHQRALARLARAEDEHRREGSEQATKGRRRPARHILHSLQITTQAFSRQGIQRGRQSMAPASSSTSS
ncbi:MAG TPA: hypothetical protein VK548_30395, partial [Candidatus Acidoferrum sp.]|nr:hypothetical protein [Candidatus Acidoferrum sp.]